MSSTFADDGYAIVASALAPEECREIGDRLAEAGDAGAGSRSLLDHPVCERLALRLKGHAAIVEHLPTDAVAVQCTLFDKTPSQNWLVPFHQDLSVPVRERVDDPRCGGWSEKEGALFVQPPVEVLESLVAVRLHLDDCGAENGPLRVVPRSHRKGRISDAAVGCHRRAAGEVECVATMGDAILMRPLLLHASSKAIAPSRRRVLHFLFGPPELPCGLSWARRV